MMSLTRPMRTLCPLLALLACTGLTQAQTNPAPRTAPFTEDFSAGLPSNFAGWNGINGGSVTNQGAAELSNPTGDAPINNGVPSTTGGLFFDAGGTNIGVTYSTNATNGANQWAFAMDTTGLTGLTLAYDLTTSNVQGRPAQMVAQYRLGGVGPWNTLPVVTGNPYTSGALNEVVHVSMNLPTDMENQPVVQVRFANWRGAGSGSSSRYTMDNLAVTAGTSNPTDGACCLPTGICVPAANAAACAGVFFAFPTTCTATPCAFSTGACCAADGSCSFILSTDACVGTLTVGGACSPNICPPPAIPGACCLGAGNCVAATSLDNCIGMSGSYQGANTVCDTNSCPAAPQIVISQVYGGGGNSGATWTNDFIEIFNRGTTPVNLSGYSVQYASATGGTWAVTALGVYTLQPGQYYLVSEAPGAGGSQPLPTADASGNIAMSATGGKVALVSTIIPLSGTQPVDPTLLDLVGYGTATGFEGAAAPALNNTSAALRNNNGCDDSGNNSVDFTVIIDNAFLPRNTASTLNPCGGVVPTTGACCTADGLCAVVNNAAACSGIYLGDNSTCSAGICAASAGSCCTAAGACSYVASANCDSGSVFTLGGVCTPNTCPVVPTDESCCRGTTCVIIPAGTCSGTVAGSNAILVNTCGAGNALASCCFADYSHDGNVTIDDLFLYLNAYFTGSPWANVGGDGVAAPVIDDLFLFINAYFTGCI